MKTFLSLTILIAACFSLPAQDQPMERLNLQQFSDERFGMTDQETGYEELYENLAVTLAEPLDLNVASEEQLRMLGVLSEIQLRQLINYRAEQGKFLSIYELQAVPNIDLQTVYQILPFVTVEDPTASINKSLLQRMSRGNNTYLIVRQERSLEEKKGFSETLPADQRFNGSPDRTLVRFRSSHVGDFSFGFTMEKDAGEAITWKPRRNQFGFDYNSFHIHLQNKKRWSSIIIGDFQVQAGQGLVMSPAFGLGKGSETIHTTMKSNAGLLPHTSSAESGFLRGIGGTYLLHRNLKLTGFLSRVNRDARLLSDSSGITTASAIQATGMHRNEKEINAKNNLTEQTSGAILNYRSARADAGIIVSHTSFERNIEGQRPVYGVFMPRGNNYSNASVFFNYSLHNLLFFSEAARAYQGGTAMLAGLMGSLSAKLDISMVYRNYQRNYHAVYSNAFGESSTTQNEYGFYWGIKYKWNRKFQLSGYADIFYFPWLRFRDYAPGGGHEMLIRLNYQPTRKSLFFIQAREENKTRNVSREGSTYNTDNYSKINYLIHTQYYATRDLRFRTRVQLSTFRFAGKLTKGTAIMQDVQWRNGRLTLTARHAIFDTDDHDNRHYAYEDDVWLAFSIPAYSGRGTRNYIIAEYKINRNITIWLRYSRTRFIGEHDIGSELEAISGNEKNDIKVQVMFKL